MKRSRIKAALALVLATTVVMAFLAACGSAPASAKNDGTGTLARTELKSEDQITTLEHQGTAVGVTQVPQWLMEYTNSGIPGVEALKEFEGKNVFIADEIQNGDNPATLQMVRRWVNSFNAQQQIAATINTRVVSAFQANESKVPNSSEMTSKFENAINTLNTASYSGARKEADWWVKQRVSSKGQPDVIRYTGYVLYTIPAEELKAQVVSNIEKAKKENPGLDLAFDAVAVDVLQRGVNANMDRLGQ